MHRKYDWANDSNYPYCPLCGMWDEVEGSISPEKYDGYCYRCQAPFKAYPPDLPVRVIKEAEVIDVGVTSDPLPHLTFSTFTHDALVDAVCKCGHYQAGVDGVCRRCHSWSNE